MMDWLRHAREKAGERQMLFQKQNDEESRLDALLDKVMFWQGSKTEYEEFRNHVVKIIDTGDRNGSVSFRYLGDPNTKGPQYLLRGSLELKRKLVEAGIEAIIRDELYTRYSLEHRGIPVARDYSKSVSG